MLVFCVATELPLNRHLAANMRHFYFWPLASLAFWVCILFCTLFAVAILSFVPYVHNGLPDLGVVLAFAEQLP